MLNSETGNEGSGIFELVVGLVLILGVGFGVYQVQHSHPGVASGQTAVVSQQ